MATFRALTNQSGSLTRIGTSDDLAVGSGINTTAGGLTIASAAGTTTMSDAVTLTGAGTALTVNNNATVTGVLTSTGGVNADGGVDRSSAATLALGGTTATAVNIGRTGQLTTVLGDFQVDGVTTLVGTTDFTANAEFNGNVTVGDAVTDTIEFVSRVLTDIHFLKEVNHTIDIDDSTTTNTAGGNMTISAANGLGLGQGGEMTLAAGAGGTSATGGGEGGANMVSAGDGGAGNGTGAGGEGGVLALQSGIGGIGGAAGAAANGGAITIDAGAGGASGTTTGNSGVGGAVSIQSGAGGASSVSTEQGGQGGASDLTGGTGGAGLSSSAAGNGGASTVAGGVGGASAGASGTAGVGGNVSITGGAAGSDAGGTGALGGSVSIAAGAGSGAVADGNINIGITNTANIAIGAAGAAVFIDGDSFSIDATAASNLTVSGAAADLTLGARGATITLNESGDTTLDGGFTATSIVGALNELFASSGSGSTELTYDTTAGETLVAGNLVCMDNDGGTPRAFLTDINETAERENPVGIAKAGAAATAAVTVIVGGKVAIPDALWASVPVVGDVGKKVYADGASNGEYTLTPPTASGDNQIRVGIVAVGGSGAVEIIVQIGEGVQQ